MRKKESIYDFTVFDIMGNPHRMKEYEGKVLLIINSAIHCSFTPTYHDLEMTYRKYHDQGFEILDFPCNQFHGEAMESDAEIDRFCKENYHTTFPRFSKTEVNGENALPLFEYLARKKPFLSFDKANPMAGVIASIHIKEGPGWEKKKDIKWNFTKFLIDRHGNIKKRFECTSNEKDVNKAIEYILDHQLEDENVLI
jgi:glutathione peroxidase